jgi:hypothetical protein
MNKKAAFDIPVYCAQFLIWSGFPDEYPESPGLSPEEYNQGFAWASEVVTFIVHNFGVNECFGAHVEVWEADEISLHPDTIRAIVLPFTITKGGLVVSGLYGNEQTVPFTPGNYALVMEMKPRNDDEYLNSQEYQEDMDGGHMKVWCHLTMVPKEEPVQPEILQVEKELFPTYPLLMGK